MSEATESETFVVTNPDGSFSLDPYAGKSRDDLKDHCRNLCSALTDWQQIAMLLHEGGKVSLSSEQREMVERLIEAYRD